MPQLRKAPLPLPQVPNHLPCPCPTHQFQTVVQWTDFRWRRHLALTSLDHIFDLPNGNLILFPARIAARPADHPTNMNTKTAVVTGASSGIGLALTQALLHAGWNVVATARTITQTQAPTRNYIPIDGDIANSATADKVFTTAKEEFGQVDLLINNAGIFVPKPFHEYTQEDYNRILGTNVTGAFHMTQRALQQMLQHNGGHILNISTTLALQPIRGVNAGLTSLTKGGLDALTRELAIEYSQYNIRVNTIAPGIVDTPMHSPEQHEALQQLHPIARLATTREIVDAALYLQNATFVTGHILYVDGGAQAGKW